LLKSDPVCGAASVAVIVVMPLRSGL
jgi:hypothetical protein